MRRSARPADPTHPLGYGPERYYWALLAATGMFVVGGIFSIFQGIRALLHPPRLEAFWVGVTVLVIALVLDSSSRLVATRTLRGQASRAGVSSATLLRESPDPTVTTIYFEDTIDVLGAALALVALVLHRARLGVAGRGRLPDHRRAARLRGRRLAARNRGLLSNQAVAPERRAAPRSGWPRSPASSRWCGWSPSTSARARRWSPPT